MTKIRNAARVAALAAMALSVCSIGGTWAAWSKLTVVKNEFMTAKYGTFLSEEWEEPENWQPGITQEKRVVAANDGTIPVVVKVTMDQEWVGNKERSSDAPGPALIYTEDGEPQGFAAVLNFGEGVAALASGRAEDEYLRLGLPYVDDFSEAEGKWLLIDEDPLETGHYTFYYIGALEAGSETPALLESVTMNPALTTGRTGSTAWYEEDADAPGGFTYHVEYQCNENGFDGCEYTLDIHMQTVQATAPAVLNTFQGQGAERAVAEYLAQTAAAGDGGYDASDAPVKTLLLRNATGDDKVYYEPYRDTDGKGMDDPGYWFMSFTNMVPGGTYTDRLHIQSDASRTYRVYMRVRPKEDAELADNEKDLAIRRELLEKIAMRVWFQDTDGTESLLYDGDATGYHYEGSGDDDLYGLVPLGIYHRKDEGTVRVELVLDPEIGLEEDGSYRYADQLTKIDWEFYVQQETGSSSNSPGGSPRETVEFTDEPVPGESWPGNSEHVMIPDEEVPLQAVLPLLIPKTGDDRPVYQAMAAAVGSLGLLCVFGWLGFAGPYLAERKERALETVKAAQSSDTDGQ